MKRCQEPFSYPLDKESRRISEVGTQPVEWTELELCPHTEEAFADAPEASRFS